jgi:hypothetical protein
MPRGFGVPQPKKRSSGKTALKDLQQPRESAASEPEPQVNVAMQAEVEVALALLEQDDAADLAQAWAIGIYNPLGHRDPAALAARGLTVEEEDWLYLARLIGWLQVESDLEAIYFTAPPPDFALEQADWYLRPDLTNFLMEPVRLCDVVQQYPVPLAEVQAAIERFGQRLGWTAVVRSRFIQEMFGRPEADLSEAEWRVVAFELGSRCGD